MHMYLPVRLNGDSKYCQLVNYNDKGQTRKQAVIWRLLQTSCHVTKISGSDYFRIFINICKSFLSTDFEYICRSQGTSRGICYDLFKKMQQKQNTVQNCVSINLVSKHHTDYCKRTTFSRNFMFTSSVFLVYCSLAWKIFLFISRWS